MVVPASLNFNCYRVLQSVIERYILTYFHVASRTVLKIHAKIRALIFEVFLMLFNLKFSIVHIFGTNWHENGGSSVD